MDGKYHEVKNLVGKIATYLNRLKGNPDLFRRANELVKRYSPKHNPNAIKEGRLNGDFKEAMEIWKLFKNWGLDEYGH
jgi:HEPN domain-containing protein